jgi:hypothetical protein
MWNTPYVSAAIVAICTAVLYTAYVKISEPDETKLSLHFARVLVASLIVGVSFVFMTHQGDDVLSEPFMAGGLADF